MSRSKIKLKKFSNLKSVSIVLVLMVFATILGSVGLRKQTMHPYIPKTPSLIGTVKPTFVPVVQPTTRPPRTENEFNVETIQPGDKIVGMELVSKAPFNERARLMWGNAKVAFKGRAAITGKIVYTGGHPIEGADVACFDVSQQSALLLPQIIGRIDSGYVFFCFRNQEIAKSLLPIDKEKEYRTITIENYTIGSTQSEGASMADLVDVVK